MDGLVQGSGEILDRATDRLFGNDDGVNEQDDGPPIS